MNYFVDHFRLSIQEALSETLEQLIFKEIEQSECPDQLPVLSENTYLVSIELLGPLKSNLKIIVDNVLASLITAEMSGEDIGSDSEGLKKDALSELINTVAGRFMAKVTPQDESFTLGLPVCSKISNQESPLGDAADDLLMRYSLGDQYIYCLLGMTL